MRKNTRSWVAVLRMSMGDAARDVAPPPPPCFLNRESWVGYLVSAAKAQNQKNEPKVIFIVNAAPVLNRDFDFCADCTKDLSATMQRANKCKPNWIKED